MKKGLICFCVLYAGLLTFGWVQAYRAAVWKPAETHIETDAFVYILGMGLQGELHQYRFVYRGLRVGFAVGDGQYIVTAAHCVDDFDTACDSLFYPLVISPYYGDIVPAEIVAIDHDKDIAILKPSWDLHPALQLDTADRWKQSARLVMASYPPRSETYGGDGTLSYAVMKESAPLISSTGSANHRLQVGPARYPGPGWSGSAFIVPETGTVAGLLSCKQIHPHRYFFTQRRLLGPDANDIRQLFEVNALSYAADDVPVFAEKHDARFRHILHFLEAMTAGDTSCQDVVRELCADLPESFVLHLAAGLILPDPNDGAGYGRRAVELAPDSSFAHAVYGMLLSRERHQMHHAAVQFRHAAALDPDNLFAQLGYLRMTIDSDPNAASVLGQDLIARWPQEAAFQFEYSRLLRNLGKYQDELPVIQAAVALSASEGVPYLYQRHLADSLAVNGHNDAAEQAYETLLEMHQCSRCRDAYAAFLEKTDRPERAAEVRNGTERRCGSP